MHEQPVYGHWKYQVCSCMENPGSCFLAWCCPCFSLGRTMHRLGIKRYNEVVAIVFGIIFVNSLMGFVLASSSSTVVSGFLSLVLGIYIYMNRELLRKKLGIPSDPCDPVVSICCQCCVMAQMANQVGLTDCQIDAPMIADLSQGAPGAGTGAGAVAGVAREAEYYPRQPQAVPMQPQAVVAIPMGPGGCVHPGLGAAAAANGGMLPPFCPNCSMPISQAQPQQVAAMPMAMSVGQPQEQIPVAVASPIGVDYDHAKNSPV